MIFEETFSTYVNVPVLMEKIPIKVPAIKSRTLTTISLLFSFVIQVFIYLHTYPLVVFWRYIYYGSAYFSRLLPNERTYEIENRPEFIDRLMQSLIYWIIGGLAVFAIRECMELTLPPIYSLIELIYDYLPDLMKLLLDFIYSFSLADIKSLILRK